MSIRQMLSYIFENYPEATKARWGAESEMFQKFEYGFKELLQDLPLVQNNSNLSVKPSTGKGVWAGVPWIAFLDKRETDSITKGMHAIFLFREDMSGVYLAMGLGITEFKEAHPHTWPSVVETKVAQLRTRFGYLTASGFEVGPGFDLRSKTARGRSYGTGVSVYKLYERDNLPSDQEIEQDIAALLTAYSDYVQKRETPSEVPLVVRESTPVVQVEPTLGDVVTHFASALKESHIWFGDNHQDLVRSFMTSLVTKRFVILTGLSGSGKTQIAMRFGEWLGKDRSLLVPVRPDWTGAEALFGYEDALLKDDNGRRAWHVPEVLQFMLKAARDTANPYLLILDEMNLAHVERYFADVLSGMESGQPCLPNLKPEASDGLWRCPEGEAKRIAFPRNLFIVGTVNVDETTYMFSPKVLDRANTFEFRVTRDDLQVDAEKPTACKPAPTRLANYFLKVAKDDHFQANRPATERDRLAAALQDMHDILADGGFEFGHRVFYEVLRFAAIWQATGDEGFESVLDRQVMQKILPRLHGTRRRLEPILCALGQYCHELKHDPKVRFDPEKVEEAQAKLKLSFSKVKRMTKAVRINQFASFTE
ncbi:MAG: 5-methylcytosine-specific restriction related enzyme [Symbiobacteriaceae bacterium]|jgi:5-methylcytosine-specific restriction protein B|nr:5-methylcytosine-specific restriction related enzyme [Symbiobacteriaceae bacterium]